MKSLHQISKNCAADLFRVALGELRRLKIKKPGKSRAQGREENGANAMPGGLRPALHTSVPFAAAILKIVLRVEVLGAKAMLTRDRAGCRGSAAGTKAPEPKS